MGTLLLYSSETEAGVAGGNKLYLLLDHCLASMKFGAFAKGPARFQPLCWEVRQKGDNQHCRAPVLTAVPEHEESPAAAAVCQ